jgi:alpha-ketoglutarate-dependent taurine dioxygenase
MLTHPVVDPRAWRASTIDEARSWYYPLPERCLAALHETIRRLRLEPRTITDLHVGDTACGPCADDLRPALAALERGRGFVIIEGLASGHFSAVDLQTAYWLMGQLLGQPVTQNVQGTLLYDVRDTGQDVRYGARFSVTSAETGFHTDNSFGEAIVDYVGLLCINTAKAGGRNQVVSAHALHAELSARYPEVLQTLQQPFHVDRRGGLRPGEAPTIQFPVLGGEGDALVCRYLRYWIEAGHAKVAQPLTAAQQHALALLDQVLGNPALHVAFDLKPSDMFFINNRWILHNRSAFEDYSEPQRKRHYVRLWLQRR